MIKSYNQIVPGLGLQLRRAHTQTDIDLEAMMMVERKSDRKHVSGGEIIHDEH